MHLQTWSKGSTWMFKHCSGKCIQSTWTCGPQTSFQWMMSLFLLHFPLPYRTEVTQETCSAVSVQSRGSLIITGKSSVTSCVFHYFRIRTSSLQWHTHYYNYSQICVKLQPVTCSWTQWGFSTWKKAHANVIKTPFGGHSYPKYLSVSIFCTGDSESGNQMPDRAVLMSDAGDQTIVTVSPIITNTLTNAICQMTSLFRFSWRAYSLSVPGQNVND